MPQNDKFRIIRPKELSPVYYEEAGLSHFEIKNNSEKLIHLIKIKQPNTWLLKLVERKTDAKTKRTA